MTTTTPPATPADLTNPLVEVWISSDGGPLVPQPDGAFARPDNSFTGATLDRAAGYGHGADPVDPRHWGDGLGTLGDSRERTFGPPKVRCFDNPGTGTPGYWHKIGHWVDWGIRGVTIGGVDYTAAEAIAYINMPVKGDKTLTMFPALVAAKLNVRIGNDDSCISATIALADRWMRAYPPGSGVKANERAWKIGEPFYKMLDQYNNGYLCAPHRD